MNDKSAFLIVKTFPKLYRDYVKKYNIEKDFYAIPRKDKKPEESKIKYRGVDRDPLSPLSVTSNDIKYVPDPLVAELRLDDIEKEERALGAYILNNDDALNIYSFLEDRKVDYEIIWIKLAGSHDNQPKGYQSIGYEASYFFPEAYSVFSPSCDCMLFPRWHGTDKEGKLFLKYYEKLNSFGLFDTPKDAEEFLKHYLSFDWTEHDEYEIIEVFLKIES